MKKIKVVQHNKVINVINEINEINIIVVEQCVPPPHLCVVQFKGSKGCQMLFEPHFSYTQKKLLNASQHALGWCEFLNSYYIKRGRI